MLIHEFLLLSQANHSEKVAVVHGKERVTYASLSALSKEIAGWLVEQGLKPGERVAILTDNPVHYISSYFGVLQAGGIVVGLNTQTSERSLDTILLIATPLFYSYLDVLRNIVIMSLHMTV